MSGRLDGALLHNSFYKSTSLHRIVKHTRKNVLLDDLFREKYPRGKPQSLLHNASAQSQRHYSNRRDDLDVEPGNEEGLAAEPPANVDTRLPRFLQIKPPKDRKRLVSRMPHEEFVGSHPFRIMIVGASGRGKTVLIRHLYDHFYSKYFDDIHVWSKSFYTDDNWRHLSRKPTSVHVNWNGPQMLRYLTDNRKVVERKGIDKSNTLLQIVDDFAADRSATTDPVLREVAFNSRHGNQSVVFLTQSYMRYDSDLRKNLTHLFVFRPTNEEETTALQNEQCIPLISKAQFRELLNYATSDPHSFLMIDHTVADPTQTYRKGLNEVLSIDEEAATELATARGGTLRQLKRKRADQSSTGAPTAQRPRV